MDDKCIRQYECINNGKDKAVRYIWLNSVRVTKSETIY